MLNSCFTKGVVEAGCDEAGRGCLAGPVFAAAVILPENYKNDWLNDSKQLSEKRRHELRLVIEEESIDFAVAQLDHQEIDEVNILRASFFAMHRALDNLSVRPEQLLIDGNRFIAYQELPFHCMVKGDGRFLSIAAASILAKTYRDEFMQTIHEEYPHYQWNQNKGYPTAAHREAIRKFGITPYHRRSFRLLPEQLDLFDQGAGRN